MVLLPACSFTQDPTPSEKSTTSNRQFGDIIPDGPNVLEDWATDDGLELRDNVIRDEKWGDFTLIEGILPSVYFEFDSYSITESQRAKLQEASTYMKANAELRLLLEGHCDWHGTGEYNLVLGDRRANSVNNYLRTLGITPERLEPLSKGSLEATVGASKSQASQDRRVDLIILKK